MAYICRTTPHCNFYVLEHNGKWWGGVVLEVHRPTENWRSLGQNASIGHQLLYHSISVTNAGFLQARFRGSSPPPQKKKKKICYSPQKNIYLEWVTSSDFIHPKPPTPSPIDYPFKFLRLPSLPSTQWNPPGKPVNDITKQQNPPNLPP